MPNYAKFLKDIITMWKRFEDFKTVAMTSESSMLLQLKIPANMEDP